MGTAMFWLTPKICMEAAPPANSATPRWPGPQKRPVTITECSARKPNSSRIKIPTIPASDYSHTRAHLFRDVIARWA